MKTIIILLLLTCSVYGQQNLNKYFVAIGNYKCSPSFYENPENSDGMLSASDEAEIVSNPPIYFPKRTDTIFSQSQDKKITKKLETTDHYQFECGEDSIVKNEIDSLIKGQITVTCNSKPLKLLSYVLSITYADGERYSLELTNKKINENKKATALFKSKKEITYLGISTIEFINNKGQKLMIGEGYCWRIIK